MPSKAIAVHSLFLIGTITLFLIFTIILLFHFILGLEPSEATCTAKYMNYCERWALRKSDPMDWDEIEPKGCEKFKVTKPSSLDDCNIT